MNKTMKMALIGMSIIASNPIFATSKGDSAAADATNTHERLLRSIQEQINDHFSNSDSRDAAPAASSASERVSFPSYISNDEMIRLLNKEKVFPGLSPAVTGHDRSITTASIISGLKNGTMRIVSNIDPNIAIYAQYQIRERNSDKLITYVYLRDDKDIAKQDKQKK
ncbi:MAG: hypothetical protein Q8K36_02145 [Alphaproteobacteria bacterium]|nr:hypothetical protein [Alphaproteobacteria bacterium]